MPLGFRGNGKNAADEGRGTNEGDVSPLAMVEGTQQG
jgi:hypothetical protein